MVSSVEALTARKSTLGVFEFVIALVLISTIGKVASNRRRAPERLGQPAHDGHGDLAGIREIVDDLSTRLERIEEERDFYKALLDSPERPRGIRPPAGESAPSGPQ